MALIIASNTNITDSNIVATDVVATNCTAGWWSGNDPCTGPTTAGQSRCTHLRHSPPVIGGQATVAARACTSFSTLENPGRIHDRMMISCGVTLQRVAASDNRIGVLWLGMPGTCGPSGTPNRRLLSRCTAGWGGELRCGQVQGLWWRWNPSLRRWRQWQHCGHLRFRQLSVQDSVFVRNFGGQLLW